MVLDYELIMRLHNEGFTYREVWEYLQLPIKYTTFESAVMNYKKTGKKRKVGLPEEYKELDKSLGRVKGLVTSMADKLDSDAALAKQLYSEFGVPEHLMNLPKEKEIEQPKTKDEILELLKKGAEWKDISSHPVDSYDIVEDLRKEGYCIDYIDDKYIISTNPEKKRKDIVKEWDGTTHLRIGVVSDTHIGNINNQMTFLNHLYDRFEDLGITDVYHAGDVSDGWYPNRSDQIYELHALGADRQVDYICKHYPKKPGITTHFIIGNHDYTFIRNTGLNIGPAIELRRSDMKYLGINNARVWLTPNCDMELNHPADGSAYAMSYSIQKYIDSLSGGDKPKILINGHHHKYLSMFYRNIHAIECPCTEAQTGFMKGKRIAAHMGGLVLDIYVDKTGTIERFSVELIPLYKALENDY